MNFKFYENGFLRDLLVKPKARKTQDAAAFFRPAGKLALVAQLLGLVEPSTSENTCVVQFIAPRGRLAQLADNDYILSVAATLLAVIILLMLIMAVAGGIYIGRRTAPKPPQRHQQSQFGPKVNDQLTQVDGAGEVFPVSLLVTRTGERFHSRRDCPGLNSSAGTHVITPCRVCC